MSFGGVFGEMSSTVLKASNHSLDRRQQEQLSSKSTTRLGSTFVKLKEEASSNNVGDRTRRHPPQGLDSSSSSSSSPYSSNMLLSAEFNKLKTDITESASRRGSAYSLPHQRAVSNPLAFESGSMTENAVISNLLNPENWSIRKTIMKSIEMLTEANFTTNKSSADTITKGPQPTITQLRGQPPSSLLFKKSSGDLIGSQGGGGGGSSSSVLNVDSTNAFSLTSKTSLSPSHQSGKLSFSAGNRLSSTSTEDRYSSSTSPRGPSVFVSSDSRRQSVQPNIDILSVNDSSPEELSPRRPSVYVGGEAHRQSQFNPLLSPQSTSNSRRRSSTFPGLGANSTSSRYELDMNTLSLRASALLVEPEAANLRDKIKRSIEFQTAEAFSTNNLAPAATTTKILSSSSSVNKLKSNSTLTTTITTPVAPFHPPPMHSQYSSNQASISAHQLAGTSEERRFSDMASEEAFKKSLQVNTFSSESESRRRLSSILNKNLSGVGGIVTPAPAAAASITAPIISFSKSLTATTSSNPKLLTEASDPSSSSSTGIKGGLVVAAESPKLNATTASITTSAQADTIKAFKTIIKASAIMNSPTNMENAARKAAFYDQIIAGAEASESTGAGVRRVVGGGGADEDDAQKLMWATERAVRAAERAARAKEAEENEKIRDGEDSLLLYKKQLGSTPKMASSTSTTTKIDQPSSSKASKSSSPNIAISVTPDSPSSINTEPSRKTSKATSKLKTLMHNLVIPTMAQHLEDTKDIQGFEFNENMARLKLLNNRVQQVIHGIFRDIQHDHVEKEHVMSTMFMENLETMKTLTREALEAEYAELLDKNTLTKQIEKLESDAAEMKKNMKEILSYNEKLKKELDDYRVSHTSNAEEQEILLTDLGKLRLQTKALRSKVRRLEETNTRIVGENERLLLLQQHHIQQHQQLSRPASARSTFSDRVKANRQRGDSAGKGEFSKLNNYQSRAGDETHHNNTSLSKSKGEGKEEVEEEDFGSTPSLKAQWDKQKMLNEMNEKISNGSLKEVLVNNIPTIDSSDDDNDYDSDYDNSDMEEEEEEEDDNDTDDVGGKLVDIDGNEGEEEDNEGNGGGDYAFFGMSSREYKRTAGYGSGPEIDHQAAQHHQHQYRHHHGGDDDDSMHGDVVKEFCAQDQPTKVTWNASTHSTMFSESPLKQTSIVYGAETRDETAVNHSRCKDEIAKLKDLINRERAASAAKQRQVTSSSSAACQQQQQQLQSQFQHQETMKMKHIFVQLTGFLEKCLKDVEQENLINSNAANDDNVESALRLRRAFATSLTENQDLIRSILETITTTTSTVVANHQSPQRPTLPKKNNNNNHHHHTPALNSAALIDHAVRHLRPSIDEKVKAEFNAPAFAHYIHSMDPSLWGYGLGLPGSSNGNTAGTTSSPPLARRLVSTTATAIKKKRPSSAMGLMQRIKTSSAAYYLSEKVENGGGGGGGSSGSMVESNAVSPSSIRRKPRPASASVLSGGGGGMVTAFPAAEATIMTTAASKPPPHSSSAAQNHQQQPQMHVQTISATDITAVQTRYPSSQPQSSSSVHNNRPSSAPISRRRKPPLQFAIPGSSRINEEEEEEEEEGDLEGYRSHQPTKQRPSSARPAVATPLLRYKVKRPSSATASSASRGKVRVNVVNF